MTGFDDAGALRRTAEAQVRDSDPPPDDPADLKRLVHELQVHQVELEMQNNELVKARDERESALAESERLHVDLAARLAELTVLNQRLAKTQDQLLQSEKMASIGLLAAGVAHEINNPIAFVNANLGTLVDYVDDLLEVIEKAEQLATRNPDPLQLSALQRLKEEKGIDFVKTDIKTLLAESLEGVDRVRKIVQNLKDFSHVGEEAWGWADLRAGIESTLSLVWNEIRFKAEVEKHYGELPQVYCVGAQLNQVWMNLLVNAAQAMTAPGLITINAGVVMIDDAPRVWVEIRDTGNGILPADLPHLFDPFFTTKPVGRGTGLGLSLAWSIVQKHQGTIEVNSTVGAGSVFRITLPVNGTFNIAETPDGRVKVGE